MTTPAQVGQFTVPASSGLDMAAGQIATSTQTGSQSAGVVPAYRQGKIISYDGGTPPTCTVTFDGTTNVAGIRFANSYFPAVNDVVVCVTLGGVAWILGTLATASPLTLAAPTVSATGTGTALNVTNAASIGGDLDVGGALDAGGAATLNSLTVSNDVQFDGLMQRGAYGHGLVVGNLKITGDRTTATTDGSGWMTVTHNLGGTPDAVVVSPLGHSGGSPIQGFNQPDFLTSTTFQCRCFSLQDPPTAIANTSLTISWLAFANIT